MPRLFTSSPKTGYRVFTNDTDFLALPRSMLSGASNVRSNKLLLGLKKGLITQESWCPAWCSNDVQHY